MSIEKKALEYAIGTFLTEWDESLTNDELMEQLEGGTADILVWEPFEGVSQEWLADHIETLAASLVITFGGDE